MKNKDIKKVIDEMLKYERAITPKELKDITDRLNLLEEVLNSCKLEIQALFDAIMRNNHEGMFDEISFTYKHMNIVNPFIDTCCMMEVNPIEYYGYRFVESELAKFIIDYGLSLKENKKQDAIKENNVSLVYEGNNILKQAVKKFVTLHSFSFEDSIDIINIIISEEHLTEKQSELCDFIKAYDLYGSRWSIQELVDYMNMDNENMVDANEVLNYDYVFELSSGRLITWRY